MVDARARKIQVLLPGQIEGPVSQEKVASNMSTWPVQPPAKHPSYTPLRKTSFKHLLTSCMWTAEAASVPKTSVEMRGPFLQDVRLSSLRRLHKVLAGSGMIQQLPWLRGVVDPRTASKAGTETLGCG